MQNYYVFRHCDYINEVDISPKGHRQIITLVNHVNRNNLVFNEILTSLYPRCLKMAQIIATKLEIENESINMEVRLNTQQAKKWNVTFNSDNFQKILPQAGSKYAAAVKICPELLIDDGKFFINQIQRHSEKIQSGNDILCISHNTMILAAASLVEKNKLSFYQRMLNLKGCQGIKFSVNNGKIFYCKKIVF